MEDLSDYEEGEIVDKFDQPISTEQKPQFLTPQRATTFKYHEKFVLIIIQ